MRNFKELTVWNKVVSLAHQIYELTYDIPRNEQFGLTSQLRRCSVSIPSNIAEGCSRGDKEFCRFMSISLGSAFELETQLIILSKLGKVSQKQLESLMIHTIEVQKMLAVFISKIKTRY